MRPTPMIPSEADRQAERIKLRQIEAFTVQAAKVIEQLNDSEEFFAYENGHNDRQEYLAAKAYMAREMREMAERCKTLRQAIERSF